MKKKKKKKKNQKYFPYCTTFKFSNRQFGSLQGRFFPFFNDCCRLLLNILEFLPYFFEKKILDFSVLQNNFNYEL